MADATNPRDFVVVQTISTTFSDNEINVTNRCARVEIRQLPSESQQIWKIKHRSSDGGGETEEEIPSGGLFVKGTSQYQLGVRHQFEPGDTIGFAASTSMTPVLQIKEFEV